MNDKFSITTDIRQLLLNDNDLVSYIGNNIFPVVTPENITGDTVVYYRDGYGKEYSKMGVINENCKVFIAIISDNYDRSIVITKLINNIVEGTHFDTNNIKYDCKLIDSTKDYEDKKYIQILLFDID